VTVAVLSNTENFVEVEIMAFALVDALTDGKWSTGGSK
jgi:hypothetical protein